MIWVSTMIWIIWVETWDISQSRPAGLFLFMQCALFHFTFLIATQMTSHMGLGPQNDTICTHQIISTIQWTTMILHDLCCNLRKISSQVSVLQLEKYLTLYHLNLNHYNRYNSHLRTEWSGFLREMKDYLHEVCICSLFLCGGDLVQFLDRI